MAVPLYIPGIGVAEVTFRSNSQGIRMRIGADRKIKVSASPQFEYEEITNFIKSKKDWIEATIKKIDKLKPSLTTFEAGQTYQMGIICVEITDTNTHGQIGAKASVENGQDVLRITCPQGFDCKSSEQFQIFTHRAIDRVLAIKAGEILPDRLKQLAHEHGFRYSQIDFNNAKRQWGNCSSTGRICLNIQIMRLPRELQDLVMLHELCHTVEMNHSEAFHRLLNKVTGGKEKELNKKLKGHNVFY